MKIFFALTVLTTGLLLANSDAQTEVSTKIRELHKERIATLKEFVEVNVKLRQDGSASHEDIVQARLMVFNAELDAAETAEERVAIHEKIVELLRENEKTTSQGYKSGISTYPTFVKAKADRLKAEIDLMQAKK